MLTSPRDVCPIQVVFNDVDELVPLEPPIDDFSPPPPPPPAQSDDASSVGSSDLSSDSDAIHSAPPENSTDPLISNADYPAVNPPTSAAACRSSSDPPTTVPRRILPYSVEGASYKPHQYIDVDDDGPFGPRVRPSRSPRSVSRLLLHICRSLRLKYGLKSDSQITVKPHLLNNTHQQLSTSESQQQILIELKPEQQQAQTQSHGPELQSKLQRLHLQSQLQALHLQSQSQGGQQRQLPTSGYTYILNKPSRCRLKPYVTTARVGPCNSIIPVLHSK